MSHSSEIFPVKNRTFRKIKVLMRSLAVDFKAVANVKIPTASTVMRANRDLFQTLAPG